MDRASRPGWITWSTALLLTGASALLLSGSVAMAPRAPEAVATPVSAEEWAAEGDRRLAARDFSGALAAYDEALALDPTDVALYYRAGVALSHLGDREQTTALFLWVVRHGDPDGEEVRVARAWLEAASRLPPLEQRAASRP